MALVPAKSTLCRLGKTEEVALLHEAMNSFGRSLHEKGVAKVQLHIFEMFAQVFPLTMDGKDMNAVLLAEIEVAERLAEKGGRFRGFLPSGRLRARRWSQRRARLPIGKAPRHFLDSFDPGDGGFEEQLVAGDKAQPIERRLDPLTVAHHVDDARLAQAGERRLGDCFPKER